YPAQVAARGVRARRHPQRARPTHSATAPRIGDRPHQPSRQVHRGETQGAGDGVGTRPLSDGGCPVRETLFAASLLSVVGCGATPERSYCPTTPVDVSPTEAAVQRVIQLGGSVKRDEGRPGRPVVEFEVAEKQATSDDHFRAPSLCSSGTWHPGRGR